MGLGSIVAKNARRTALIAAALGACLPGAALAETLTVTDIVSPAGNGVTLSVPSVEVTDGNISETAIRALFAGDVSGNADALATLDAKRILIPEITLTFAPSTTQSTSITYRDFEIDDVVDGIAASTAIGSSEVTGAKHVSFGFGKVSTGRFDIAGLLGFYGLGTGTRGTEIKPIYSDFLFEGGNFSAEGISCNIGPVALGEFRARPLTHSMAYLTPLIVELEANEKAGTQPSSMTVKALLDYYVDMLTAFESSPMQFDGFDCSGKDDKGTPLSIASGAITMDGFKPGIYPQIAANDFKLDLGADGSLQFGNFTIKKIDFTGALAALGSADNQVDEAWFVLNMRRLLPEFDGLSLTDLALDIPDENNPGERVKATLGAFDATLGNYVNGVPADIALAVQHLLVDIPEGMTDGPGPELRANGITQVDLSLGTKVRWVAADNTIVVENLLVDAGDLGRVSVSGTLGNATSALFDEDLALAGPAAEALTLKQVTIEIEDRGAGGMLITAAARDAGQPVPAFRTTMGGMLQGMTLAVLGNSDSALKAAQALGQFIAGAPNLKLTLTSINPAGIGLADLEGADQDPTVLAGKVSIVAEASGEPLPSSAAPEAEPAPGVGADSPVQKEKLGLKAPAAQ